MLIYMNIDKYQIPVFEVSNNKVENQKNSVCSWKDTFKYLGVYRSNSHYINIGKAQAWSAGSTLWFKGMKVYNFVINEKSYRAFWKATVEHILVYTGTLKMVKNVKPKRTRYRICLNRSYRWCGIVIHILYILYIYTLFKLLWIY